MKKKISIDLYMSRVNSLKKKASINEKYIIAKENNLTLKS